MSFEERIRKKEQASTKPLSEMKVLFVEDNPTQAYTYKRYFSRAGITRENITHVSSVDDARKALGTAKPQFDLVITDFDLGKDEPTGEEVLKESRSLGIPRILHTSGIVPATDENRIRAAYNCVVFNKAEWINENKGYGLPAFKEAIEQAVALAGRSVAG